MAYKDAATNTSVTAAALDPRFRRLKFLSPDESLKVQALALEAKRGVIESQQHQQVLQRRGMCLCWTHCLGWTQKKHPARMTLGTRQMSSVIQ